DLAFASDCDRQFKERPHQLSVDFLGPLRRNRAGRIKEQRPVDHAVARYRAESEKIWKEGHELHSPIQLVAVANLSVTIPIGSVCDLQRDESREARAKPARTIAEHLVYECLSDERGKKLIQDDPLIMPPPLPCCFVEHLIGSCSGEPRFI